MKSIMAVPKARQCLYYMDHRLEQLKLENVFVNIFLKTGQTQSAAWAENE